jgi:DNA-binding SARP family transcriptional activator/Tfp pilus assembly protein PilF
LAEPVAAVGKPVAISLLGPVRVTSSGRPIPLGPARQRFVLAVLALEANRLVTTERLIDLCWPEDAPATARTMIHMSVSGLRAALAGVAGVRLDSQRLGYQLCCEPLDVDAHRFRALVAEPADRERRVELLDQALALWAGPALSGVVAEDVRSRLCQGLDELRLTALEDRFEALLGLGRHAAVTEELVTAVSEHPDRQRLLAQLMVALYRGGRAAEALRGYEGLRRRLDRELGVTPSPELQELHLAILRDDPALASPAPDPVPVPRQLPADTAAFTGRDAELAALLAAPPAGQPPATVVISAIDGMAGVGKTALAVHAAHRLAGAFPDGQLFLDLHGFTEGSEPVGAEQALDQLLRALGVRGEQIPPQLDARAALLRSRLTGRRVLLVLDNAATPAQVQPLLPGQPGCLVLVTSRHRLADLDDAQLLSLDVLPLADAVALFSATTGHQPSDTVTEIVDLCGRLPLAIRIAAARLRARPAWTLDHLAALLADHQRRLAELGSGQRSVTTAFELSYHQLSAGQRQLFRLLGQHPGADFEPQAAAALCGGTSGGAASTADQARRQLEGLLDAHLLEQQVAGRYRFHDLLADYARQLAADDPDRPAAVTRLQDHYARTSTQAVAAAYPDESCRQLPAPVAAGRGGEPTGSVLDLTRPDAAETWLDAELDNLLATAHAAGGRPGYLLHQAAVLHPHLCRRGRIADDEQLQQTALRVARSCGDRLAEVRILTFLGWIRHVVSRQGEATECYAAALESARASCDQIGEVDALNGLGNVARLQGRPGPAVDLFEQALELARRAEHRSGELRALVSLGNLNHSQGRLERSIECYRRSIELARAIADSTGQINALIGLGWAQQAQGQLAEAATSFTQAVELAGHGRPTVELHALAGLGRVGCQLGRYREATDSYRRALRLARDLGNRVGELSALIGLGDIHRSHRQYQAAADYYGQALEGARAAGSRNWQCEAQLGLGRTELATGHPDRARASCQAALGLAVDLSQPGDQVRALAALAQAEHALGRPQAARGHCRQALELLAEMNTDTAEDVTAADLQAHLADLRAGRQPA